MSKIDEPDGYTVNSGIGGADDFVLTPCEIGGIRTLHWSVSQNDSRVCGHVFPGAVKRLRQYLDDIQPWLDADPDEKQYRETGI